MNAVEILSHCRNAGIALAVDAEGKLHVRGGKDVITTLREDIKVHKATLVTILQAPLALDLTREDHRQEALAAVKRGEAVRVLSATLGEVCYCVPDEEIAERLRRAPDYRGEVIYTRAELGELAGQSPEFLRGIHQFKKTFGATLEKVNQGVNARSINTVRFYKGDREPDKGAVIEDLIDRLNESERRFEASEQALEIARAELGEEREHIDFLKQSNGNMAKFLEGLRVRVQGLEDSLAAERWCNDLLRMQRTHNPVSYLSEQDFKLLIRLCHPDKHNGSDLSKEATQRLMEMRQTQ